MTATDINATEHTITSRKDRRCEGYRCGRAIAGGDDYVRLVAFPGHDANGSDRPWVMCICVSCWREYDHARPLPARRSRRTAS
jgi:hypothetical protein